MAPLPPLLLNHQFSTQHRERFFLKEVSTVMTSSCLKPSGVPPTLRVGGRSVMSVTTPSWSGRSQPHVRLSFALLSPPSSQRLILCFSSSFYFFHHHTQCSLWLDRGFPSPFHLLLPQLIYINLEEHRFKAPQKSLASLPRKMPLFNSTGYFLQFSSLVLMQEKCI